MEIGRNAISNLLQPNYIYIGGFFDVVTIPGTLIISNSNNNQPVNISSFINQFI